MAKRTNHGRGALCRCPLHVEFLESRQLLSGIYCPESSLGKPPTPAPTDVRLDAEMRSLAGTEPSSATEVRLPVETGISAREEMHFLRQMERFLQAGTAEGGNQSSSENAVEGFQEIGIAARALNVPSFNRPRGARPRALASVMNALPSSGQGETRRTQKGRAISLANYWDIVELTQTAANPSETQSRPESHPSGFQREPEEDVVGGTRRLPLAATAEDAAEAVVAAAEQPSEAVRHGVEAVPPTPPGHLLAGLVSVDLPALERKVDAFFRQVENLAEETTGVLAGSRLTSWLVIGAITTAGYVLVHRHLRARTRAGVLAGGDPMSWEWSWLSHGAVPPPWERS